MSNVSCSSNVSGIASLPDLESNPRRPARWHLWPHGGGEEGPASVTIRIDQLKDATVELIQEAFVYGDGWFISRRNALEGVVERHPLLSMQGAQGYRLLAFWRRPADVDAYEGL